ncbi:2-phosphosulfolactate phosphatase [Actinopolyspora biskrensis]|uniref:Probable 2-phosphosulfolactate phosphatase n=1 Tax=Actinopolyspora biskrensis TaxID=1470178 RepID=A0A852Z1R4_9ACTN|nr:2-phosphosulfolactate phosphatase [Actinopolyspora biskrensis]NYH79699.1 2-phosphosulfolactate phosphatase [Actinopolyspora biskrensis]
MSHEPTDPAVVQSGHTVRFDWGLEGLRGLGADCAVLVVVDVLSFATSVDVATGAGAHVLPLPHHDDRARDAAEAAGAVLAGAREQGGYSLSPSTLERVPGGTLVGLASPNGAALCSEASELGAVVFTGCLRNAGTVAAAAGAAARNGPIGVVAAGELRGNGAFRFAVEDLLGAGAIISALSNGLGSCSVEAGTAARSYRSTTDLRRAIRYCDSGRELVSRGYGEDVELAAKTGASTRAPRLRAGVFSHR